MKLKSSTIFKVAATGLIIAGISLMTPLGYYHWHAKQAVSAAPTQSPKAAVLQPTPHLVSGTPVAISIPSLNINLNVINGYYYSKTGDWTLTLNKAQYATPTVPPNNEGGNTLIYGHYRPEVFAYLHLIKPGAQAIITTNNGYTFTYTYQSSQAYDPTDTSIFSYQGAPRLTIQTCSGSFMQHRQMYYFSYDGYSKIQ